MTQKNRTYIAIDLKSFYASVECVERRLDPMTTNLVVADLSRTEKTICLAVSPTLKSYGISGRARLFEVVQRVKEVNAKRLSIAPGRKFNGSSYDDLELKAFPDKALDYIVAPPRMAHYIEYSTRIYEIYLKYVAPEDCHVYSIDEIMMDVTHYLNTYQMSARELTGKIIKDIRETTGITATAGIGTNLYLCKAAMDIVAKHIPPDKNGVRIASLNEKSYRRILWNHQPITDFWRVGKGYAKKLAQHGLFTMGDIAKCSVGKPEDYYNEELLYKLFGINAELLIDHAWGFEPCTMKDIKAYKPETNSICSGQVLHCPYTAEKARIVVREMAEMLGLDLFDRRLVTDQLVLTVGYDIENLADLENRRQSRSAAGSYKSGNRKEDSQVEIKIDRYGRKVPKHAHGTINFEKPTSSSRQIVKTALELYDKIVNRSFLVRRITIGANHIVEEDSILQEPVFEQLDLFTDYYAGEERKELEKAEREKERRLQQAMLDIKKKYGKNAILKGTNLMEGATAASRNRQIGGHKA